MKTGSIVLSPPHIKEPGEWLECYPTIEECREFNKISPRDRTYCETIGRHTQSPRLVKLETAKKKGWIE
jgi:hypothetical protein